MAQIESICRRQNKCDEKVKLDLGMVENIVGKGKMLVSIIFSFSSNVSKAFFPRVIKSPDYVEKS